MLYNVSIERVNNDEAESGDTDRRGMLAQGVRLREALDVIHAEIPAASDGDRVEWSNWPVDGAGWLCHSWNEWETGDYVTACLHPAHAVTAASARRLESVVRGYC